MNDKDIQKIYDYTINKRNHEIKKLYNKELLNCPFCGGRPEMHGADIDWHPTYYDPDSGGDPFNITCKCGVEFSIGSWDYAETVEAWNRRVKV